MQNTTGLSRLGIWAVILAVGLQLPVAAEDWPQWRGPRRDAKSSEKGFLSSWANGPPALVFRSTGVGEGYASLAVAQEKMFTIGRHGQTVQCFALRESDGRILWQTKIGQTSRIPMSTPTVDGDRVYALDPDGKLYCLQTQNGKVVWQLDFQKQFSGRLMSGRGYGESPLIDGDSLICTPGGPDAMMIAVHKQTGKILWKASMPNVGSKGRDGAAFGSIRQLRVGGKKQYVQLLGRGLAGFDAVTGQFLWGYNDISNGTANIPTPIVRDNEVFAANGYHAGAVKLKINDAQATERTEELFRLSGGKFQNHHGGVVLVGDHVFGGHGSNNGLPTCIDFNTGKVKWRRRGPGTGSASVVYADGKLYFRYQNGVIALIAANPSKYELLGSFEIPNAGSDSWSHPVIANGRLLLREKDSVFSFDLRRAAGQVASQGSEVPSAIRKHFREVNVDLQPLSNWIATASPAKAQLLSFAGRTLTSLKSCVVVTPSVDAFAKDGMLQSSVIAKLKSAPANVLLDLAGSKLSDQGLAKLIELESIVAWNLDFTKISPSGIASLQRSINAQFVSLAGTKCDQKAIKSLAKNPKIEALDLEVCEAVTDSVVTDLATMSQLRILSLKKTGFEKKRISDKGLQSLAALENLELLNLYGNSISNNGLSVLPGFSKLKLLNLGLTPISDDGLKYLSDLRTVTHLDLTYSEGFAGVRVTDKGLVHLSKIQQLDSLELIGAKISDAGLLRLRRLRRLKSLNLVNATVTKDGIDALAKSLSSECKIKR